MECWFYNGTWNLLDTITHMVQIDVDGGLAPQTSHWQLELIELQIYQVDVRFLVRNDSGSNLSDLIVSWCSVEQK